MVSVGQNKSSSREQQRSFLPAQETALNKTLGAFDPRIGQNRFFEGPTLAPFTEFQQNVLGTGQDFVNTFGPNREIPLFDELKQTTGDLLAGRLGAQTTSAERANEVFQQTRIQPAFTEFNRNVAPVISEQFSGPGFFGTPRARAVSQAAGELGEGLETGRQEFLFGTEQQNAAIQESQANRAAQAVGLGTSVSQLPTQEGLARQQGLNQLFNFASTEQAQQQAQLVDAQNRFLESTAFMAPDDQALLMGLLGLNFTSGSGKSAGRDFNIGVLSS